MSSGVRGYLDLFPTDLVLVGALGVFTISIGSGAVGTAPGQFVVGLFAVLFAPGYALVSALFPKQNADESILDGIRIEVTGNDGQVTVAERLFLACGLSVCLVPLLGIALSYTPRGVGSGTLLVVTGVVTVVFAFVGAIRRQQALPWERYNPTVTTVVRTTADKLAAVRAKSILTLFVIVGLVVAAGGIGVAVIDTDRGEQFTAFYLLSSDPMTGEAVADDYPTEIAAGESDSLTVGITNNEGRTTEYTVVAQIQSIDESGQLRQAQTFDEFTVTLQPGEQWEQSRTITPELTGDNLRVTYLLYTGELPDSSLYRPENAYRSAHIWIDVPDDTSTDGQRDGRFDSDSEIGQSQTTAASTQSTTPKAVTNQSNS